MSFNESNIKQHYMNYDEDHRLVKDKSHSVEFITTIHYLDKYIDKGNKILDVGAGTGKYAFYYGEKECEVTAVDLSEKHISIMKSKLQNEKINIVQGNALELSLITNDLYDVVLCLGPIYHLHSKKDRDKCIKECLKVLKPGGIIATSYISRFSTFVNIINRNEEYINNASIQSIISEGIRNENYRDCFYLSTYEEIENLMMMNKINKISHMGSDGISEILSKKINNFNDKEFQLWMKYHFETCENPTLIGYSQHGLYIGSK